MVATRPPDGSTAGTPERGDGIWQQAHDQALKASGAAAAQDDGQDDEQAALEAKLLLFAKDARSVAERYTSFARQKWARNYDAFQNKHFRESKYQATDYRARSKLFVPKTRAAIMKKMASFAASLFSTVDAMAITAGNESDANSRASAALMQEVINYRCDRTSGRNAIKWFLTCMGACQDAMITGITCSKQFWLREQTPVKTKKPIMAPDPATGQPIQVGEELVDEMKTTTNRPESVLISPELVIIDAGADWRSPAQSAAFLCILWPMKVGEIATAKTTRTIRGSISMTASCAPSPSTARVQVVPLAGHLDSVSSSRTSGPSRRNGWLSPVSRRGEGLEKNSGQGDKAPTSHG